MKDFHSILDLNYNATEEQIRTQYRQLVRIYHPDRFSNPVDKEYAERKLQEINEAYYGLLAPERTGKGVNRRLTQSQQKYPLLRATPGSVMILLSVLFFGVLLGGLDYEALLSDDPSLADKTFIERLSGSINGDSSATAQTSIFHEWLSFSVFENYRNVLYVVDIDGQRQIEFPLSGYAPVWSPDRTQLAFLSPEREGTQIYIASVVDAAGPSRQGRSGRISLSGRRQVAIEDLSRVTLDDDVKDKITWSPDGTMLAYIAQTNDAKESVLKVAYLTSDEIISLTSPRIGIVRNISWLDDVNMLVDLEEDNNRLIYQIPIDGQATSQFVNFPSRDPSVSPSGQRVAIASDDGVYTVLRNGTELTQLTTSPSWAPAWSRSGQKIAYLSPPIEPEPSTEDERNALWVMDANGENPEQLTEAGTLTYAWSIDGNTLAFVTGNLQTQPPTLYLWRLTLDGEKTLIAEVSEPHVSWGRGP